VNYLNNNPMEKDIQDAYKKGFIDGKIEGSKCIFCDYGETAKKEINGEHGMLINPTKKLKPIHINHK